MPESPGQCVCLQSLTHGCLSSSPSCKVVWWVVSMVWDLLPGDKPSTHAGQFWAFSFSQHQIPGEMPMFWSSFFTNQVDKDRDTGVSFEYYLHSCRDGWTLGNLVPECLGHLGLWADFQRPLRRHHSDITTGTTLSCDSVTYRIAGLGWVPFSIVSSQA